MPLAGFEGLWISRDQPEFHIAMLIRGSGDAYTIQPHRAGAAVGEPFEAALEDDALVARDLHGDEAGMLMLTLVADGALLELTMPDTVAPIVYMRADDAAGGARA